MRDFWAGRGRPRLAVLVGYAVFLLLVVAGYVYLLATDTGGGLRAGLVWGAVAGLLFAVVAVVAAAVRRRR